LRNDNIDFKRHNKKLNKKVNRLLTQQEEILTKLENVANERVIGTGDERDDHCMVLVKKNDEIDLDDDEENYEYHVVRGMKRSYRARVMKYGSLHPDMEIIAVISYSPNSVNLWRRIKNDLGSGRRRKIDSSGSDFNIRDNCNEDDFVELVKEIHDERITKSFDFDL